MIRSLAAAVLCLSLGHPARAETGGASTFALIIGVNQSPERDLLPLRYADDDAARYRDLFRELGARTYLLASLDENTRRLHPEAAAEASPASSERLAAAVDAVAGELAAARRAGRRTAFYLLYAGHGGTDGQQGYVTLEDGRLTGPDLVDRVFDRLEADEKHLVVDACSAYLLVLGRGRGGDRRPLRGFAHQGGPPLLERGDIGLLLSTSSGRESHEWAAFQAGVFSHEVRSGMFGAADASGDGIIDYSEMAAFIRRANEAIPNERYRPEVFWRPPRGGAPLLDLRAALARRVEIPQKEAGHYYLEDPRGVRLADVHNGKSLAVRLLRPRAGHLYLQRTSDGREYLLPDAPAVIDTAALTPREPRVGVRSAAHDAFGSLFALPFEREERLEAPAAAVRAEVRPAEAPSWNARRIVGWSLIATAAVAVSASAELFVSARALESRIEDGAAAPAQQRQVRSYDRMAFGAAGLGGLTALAGAAVLLWPTAPVRAEASPQAVALRWVGRF
jgi:hypothetical protein